jgi:hypothetical protein
VGLVRLIEPLAENQKDFTRIIQKSDINHGLPRNSTMRAVVFDGPYKVSIQDRPAPTSKEVLSCRPE